MAATSNDRIGRSTPTIPRSDDNKDAMIRAIALSQKARKERRFRTYLWGDRRLGAGRTISLPRSALTGDDAPSSMMRSPHESAGTLKHDVRCCRPGDDSSVLAGDLALLLQTPKPDPRLFRISAI